MLPPALTQLPSVRHSSGRDRGRLTSLVETGRASQAGLLALASRSLCLSSQEFAGEGLRTLVVAYRDLKADVFEDWQKRHHEASTALEEREEKLASLYEEIERDLMVNGG